MIRRPPRSTLDRSSAASDVYKRQHYREEIPRLIKQLKASYNLSVITGDNESEKENLQKLLGNKTTLLFHQKPENKLHYIKHLQRQSNVCLLYTSDAADERSSVDLGGRRIIKKKKNKTTTKLLTNNKKKTSKQEI